MSATGSSASPPDSGRVLWNSSGELEYAIWHVFLPADHNGSTVPSESVENSDESLAHAVHAAAYAHSTFVDDTLKPQWCRVTRMLDNLESFLRCKHLSKGCVTSQLREMRVGDTLAFLTQTEGVMVVLCQQDHCTLCTSFSVLGLYSDWAIELPNDVFNNQHFQSELAHFLLYSDHGLLVNILRGVGRDIEVPRVSKCVRSHYKRGCRHRSLLWLLIKAAIQLSLCDDYKVFMLRSMCNLAMDAMDANLSSHLLHAISSKILRRLRKFRSLPSKWLHELVLATNASLREILEVRWKEIVAAQPPHLLWKPSQLDLNVDTQLSLPASKAYINNCLTNHDLRSAGSSFSPKHLPRGSLSDFFSSNGSFFEEVYRIDPYIALYDVEQAVEQGIDDWVASVVDVDQAIAEVEVLMDKYLSNARDAYKGNPEHISVMLLTGMELWVAFDKLVVTVAPGLTWYSPEVSRGLLCELLFHSTKKLHRLGRVYRYMSSRHSHPPPPKAIFSEIFSKKLFFPRYNVDSRRSTGAVFQDIQEHGPTIPSDHEIIAVYEARYSRFRRVSYFTAYLFSFFPSHHSIYSVLHANPSPLQQYPLQQWKSPFTRKVYLICSGPKDHREQKISRDTSGYDWTTSQFNDYCCSTSHRLKRYINGTSHTSNDVLAAQAECPNNLSPREFIAFGHLRSGGLLQWFNILQELRSRTLNFRRHDVYFLLAKAVSQVGPFDKNTSEWEWHQELQEPSFCRALLDELESLLVDVGVHSQDGVMMGAISLLLTCLLALGTTEDSEKVLELLLRIRRKTFYWVRELSYDLIIAPMNIERKDLLRDMAATCRSTFDVDPDILYKLVRSAEDVSALLCCAILIHANSPNDSQAISEYSRLLLERDRRLSLTIESLLREVIKDDVSNRGIDLAVCNVWSGYRPGSQVWQTLPYPNPHWLTCETAATKGNRPQKVHMNLLDGTLLVDGKSLDELPLEIREEPTYRRIFGDQRFLVVASDLPGMDFCALAIIYEHRVHFALRDNNLVIRAQHKDAADVFEVISQEKLQGDLPAKLIDGHIHWLNLSTSIIEIRPLEKLWEESSENWMIDCRPGQYRMYKGREWLVDIRSPTYEMVSRRLRCLDAPQNLTVTTLPIDTQSLLIRRIFVGLPRYNLSFFVNEDEELESRDFKNMVYDEDHCIGTLFGLESQLVLRPSVRAGEFIHRCVIVPDDQFFCERHNHHLRSVSATNSHGLTTQSVTYHTYRVDTDLGCLASDGSWRSKLYLTHLHAKTSIDWMPDLLTGRTGIQEALCLLRSGGYRSIMQLGCSDGELELPSFEGYPQLQFAIEEIKYCIERERFLFGGVYLPPTRPKLDVPSALRTAYLFQSEVVEPVSMPFYVSPPKRSEYTKLAHIVSLAVYHWLIKTESDNRAKSRYSANTSSANPARLLPLIAEVGTMSAQWPEFRFPLRTLKVNDSRLEAPLQLERQLVSYLGSNFLLPWESVRSRGQILPPSMAEVEALLQEATGAREQFRLLFLLPMLVYSLENAEAAFLSILVALAKRVPLKNPPCYERCWPLDGCPPSRATLQNCFTAQCTRSTTLQRDEEELDTVLKSGCYCNLQLRDDLVCRVTEFCAPSNPAQPSKQTFDLSFQVHCWQVTLGQLLRDRSAPKLPVPNQLEYDDHKGTGVPPHSESTKELFRSLRASKIRFQQQYINDLHNSARWAREVLCVPGGGERRPSIEELRKHYVECRDSYTDALIMLKKALGPLNEPSEQALHQSGQWPCITSDTLLRCLASTSPIELSESWRICLISLVLLLVQLQRSRRLLQFSLDNLEDELLRELENEGCRGCNAIEYPDWLLIQVQGNFLIRGIQADVAMKMISPPSRKSTVMQVNMGEGKSSVILPICAATLADGNQLVRVVVPKPLKVQMFQLLVHRLGGLINRPIYHLPFSRSCFTGYYAHERLRLLWKLLSECMHNHGILVVQPEHVLSLRLTNAEQLLPNDMRGNSCNPHNGTGSAFLDFQKWIHSCARDILDESDDILHPRFQLSYTIGPQQHMQGSPDRWTIIQQVFRLVRRHALSLARNLPDAIEYECSVSGSFPRVRIMRTSDAHEHLVSLIANDVMKGDLPSFSLLDIDRIQGLYAAIFDFISSKDVSQGKACIVEEYGRKVNLWDGLLLLRGLLAYNILSFALGERRWRVDYGLSPTRTRLAVPYRAKDVPAQTAEFGHPDLTILLTCLSYYYGGLTEEQLRTSFEILQEQDDPSIEYANWLRDHEPGTVPEPIQDLSNVKIKSSEQWDKYIFPLFARSQGAVDFYLSRIVFPKEANEFPWKLAGSSWDLAEMREHPITGFSGTNEGRYLLPTSISQHDLNHQRGSNARVISYLLQPENDFYILISHPDGERRTIPELLEIVNKEEPKIRILLDVGAQILDFSNYQLATEWLYLSPGCDGAVYFNEHDEPMVLTKDGNCRPLISSPLAQRLDRCVVYLDDAHTRGTDLKFPIGSRAAVTLGPKVTKDRLVHGCMRMRNLGHGHSVMFLAPLEVDRSIRTIVAKEDPKIQITTTDILRWAIHETWTDIQRRAPYWAQQGISHDSRYDAWSRFCSNELTREELAHAWLQPELKSLADLYAPFHPNNASNRLSILDEHPDIQQRCEDLGVLQLPDAKLEEEQEREVDREVERERVVREWPTEAVPVEHILHPDVVTFVRTGGIPATYSGPGSAFYPILTALEGSSAATGQVAHVWSPFVLATSDFCRTVRSVSPEGDMDLYLRPVHWVLSGKWDIHRVLVLLSPFEAERLMPDIRLSQHVHLHLYTPRTSEHMRPSDDLMFYSIPPVPDHWMPPWDLIDQLSVFAGQLYLRDYESYSRLRRFLGIQTHWQDLPNTIGKVLRRNKITPDALQAIEDTSGHSLLPSVLKLLLIRRKGLSFAETHMGKILQGQKLTEEDFENLAWASSIDNPVESDTETLTSATTKVLESGRPSLPLPRLSKRGWEVADSSNGDSSGRLKKHPRVS